MFLSYYYTN